MSIPRSPWLGLAVALGIGLMLGVERERRQGESPRRGAAGLRTFALVALLGGLCAVLGQPLLLAAVGLFVGAAALVSYALGDRTDAGLTTEMALEVAFVLGALATENSQLAAAAGVTVTALLALRVPLHRAASEKMSEREWLDLVLLGVSALVIWPLVPDRAMGPYHAINPYRVWQLVVAIMAIGAAGYGALRIVGPRLGLPLSGFISGFVSSTATIATMGARARNDPAVHRPAAAGAVLSNVSTVAQLAVVLGATSRATLGRLVLPLACAGIVAAVGGLIFGVRAVRSPAGGTPLRGRAAVDLKSALGFAGMIAAATLISAALHAMLGERGLWVAALIAGLADPHAAAISIASLVSAGRVTPAAATLPVLLAFTMNSVVKFVVSIVSGPRSFSRDVGLGLLAMVVAAWLGWLAS